jgi:ribosomal protein S6
MLYELFYLIGATQEAGLEKIKGDVAEIIKSNDGVFQEKETLEKRKMAYEISHETHGIYIAQRFEMEPEKTTELTKKLNLYPGVLRYVLSRADELPALKSREERIAESAAIEKTAIQRSKKETAKEEPRPMPEKTKVETQEDIDKKLEEILNI